MNDSSFDIDKIGGIEGARLVSADGGVIFIKGDIGECAYVVMHGTVQIREGGRVLETVEPGGLFGEMALIESEPRSASAVAAGGTELAVIDRSSFEHLVRDEPGFALMVMRLMSRRLRATLASGRPVLDDPPVGTQKRNTG